MYWLQVACFVFVFGVTARADEVRETLAAAAANYEKEVSAIQADVTRFFDDKIAACQQRGDLDKTLEYQNMKDAFVEESVLPDVPVIRSYRQKVKARFGHATRDYRIAHIRAIEAYTRGKDIRAAQEVKASLEKFDALQDEALIRFPPSVGRKAENPGNAEDEKKKEPGAEKAPPEGNENSKPPAPKILEPPAQEEFVVNRPIVMTEDVAGSLRVVAGGNLTLMAVCEGDLIVEPGGVALITGIVSGNATNLGGDLHFTGIIGGQLIRKAGRTVVAPKSIIGGVRQ